MTNTTNNFNKGENKGYDMTKLIDKRNHKSDNLTNVWKTWRTHLDKVLAEAGIELVQYHAPQFHYLKDTETNITLGSTVTLQNEDRTLIETNLLNKALADASEQVKPDAAEVEERHFYRRMTCSLNRLEASLAYLSGRLYERLKDSPKQVSAQYGVMKGETKASAFFTVTESYVTEQGINGERILLETHKPDDVLDFFGLEH